MLIFKPAMGASGDMVLSALVDASADGEKIANALKKFGVVSFRKIVKKGKCATAAEVKTKRRFTPSGMRREIEKMQMPSAAKEFSMAALGTLIKAERKAHGSREVHFHELGDADTLIDIVGSALALEELGAFDEGIATLPAAVGMNVAQATARILKMKRMKFFRRRIRHELLTPTGAALLSNFKQIGSASNATVVGRGAGNMNFRKANVLEVMRMPEKNFVVLETNVDDVSGEVMGYVVEKMLREGAKDACLIPFVGKKNRVGAIVQVLCEKKDAGRLTKIIMDETGTLGVREIGAKKRMCKRKIEKIGTKFGTVRFKVSEFSGKIVNAKPEYSDIRRIALKTGKSFRKIFSELCDMFKYRLNKKISSRL